MLNHLSRILIFTLILTAPLSFTGEKCPDFKPVSEISQCQQGNTRIAIVKKQNFTTKYFTDSPLAFEITVSPSPAFTANPVNPRFNPTLHERAPPTTPAIS